MEAHEKRERQKNGWTDVSMHREDAGKLRNRMMMHRYSHLRTDEMIDALSAMAERMD